MANLSAPTAVAVGSDERIYVAETSQNALLGFSSDGKFQFSMATFDEPTSVATGPGGLLYIGNSGRGNVEVYSSDFVLIAELGQGLGEFVNPTGITVDGAGNVYVTDGEANLVKVYTPDYMFDFSFGSAGISNGQFQMPTAIAINETTNELYVADQAVAFTWTGGSARVQVFGLNGAFKRSFKTQNGTDTPYVRPMGVAVDEAGRIYVSDSYQNEVGVYDSVGTYLGNIYNPDQPLRNAMGMAYAPGSHRLFVVSLNSARVETYGVDAQYPDIELALSSHDFGGVGVGSLSGAQTFDISNSGDADLVLGSITFSGTDTDDFSLLSDNCSSQTLAPGGSCSVEATFSPTSAGAKSAQLDIPSNDIYEPVASIAMSGAGVLPEVMLSVVTGGAGSGRVFGVGIDCGAGCMNTYEAGSSISLIAMPHAGSRFDGWSGGGCSGASECVIALNSDVVVSASFSPTSSEDSTYTVIASAGANGSISPAGETAYAAGLDVVFDIQSDPYYRISDVVVDGVSVGVVSEYSFTGISANHSIEAQFEANSSQLPFIEVGEVFVDHNWKRIDFDTTFVDPVVVAKPASQNDIAPAVVRLRNVDATGFEMRVQEWDYQDGLHAAEHISYVVMDKGNYVLPDGSLIEVGEFETSDVSAFGAVAFSQSFTVAPVIAASVMTSNEDDAVIGRLQNIDVDGFHYRMQEQEANEELHAAEAIGYIAWEPSMGALAGLVFEVGRSDEAVGHSFVTLEFDVSHLSIPVFVADIQTAIEGDAANLRWRDKALLGVDVRVAEEQSTDAETWHDSEEVGYFAFSGSVIGAAADTDKDGLPDSYENQYAFLDPLDPMDAQRDQDGDGVSNLEEYLRGTEPDGDLDSDGDGLSDEYERENGLDPLDSSDCPEWVCSRSYRGWRYAIP
ncbi:choice-of-anchor D domain-containing protein [Pseudomonadota bacterium]